ncbi:MAG: hypothetical protein IJB01_00980 [Bacteroidaceae bacterium]|nr:hypothetical protein [Bacteroidaceae bacterium]
MNDDKKKYVKTLKELRMIRCSNLEMLHSSRARIGKGCSNLFVKIGRCCIGNVIKNICK